ncbi:hypothetical protein [Rhodanobacter denitrificans]|uniref:hypothetical protein n=1 Tax=Rhodanobacter denitrificans TaxID=666685 RepID=UPI0016702D43|nr:hypothetical protein [Rhodanobacter denitrificans]
MSIPSRLTLAAMAGGLLLAGCAQHEAAKTTRSTTTTTTGAATTTRTTTNTAGTTHRKHAVTSSSPADEARLPEQTGIPACDDYLSSYLACHRAAAIYAPGQLQSRYEAMRTSLLRDSQNPDIRPQLATRCYSLASQLREALHGKSCAENPAPASTP